jgi:outer membrane lipoprotein-sorting protein
MRAMVVRLLALCALLVLPRVQERAPDPAPDIDKLLDDWQKKVAELKSFKARFRQEKRVSFMKRPLVSSGTLAYRDRRLLWKTEQPTPSWLALDAHEVRIYTPEFNTLEITPLLGGALPAQGGFPGLSGDPAQLRRDYAATLLPGEEKSKDLRVRLVPRTEEMKKQVQQVEVTFSETFEVKAWRLVRANGDELTLTMSDFVANAPVDDKDLTIDVPADVKIVRIGEPRHG